MARAATPPTNNPSKRPADIVRRKTNATAEIHRKPTVAHPHAPPDHAPPKTHPPPRDPQETARRPPPRRREVAALPERKPDHRHRRDQRRRPAGAGSGRTRRDGPRRGTPRRAR